jgi:hypothetical protein
MTLSEPTAWRAKKKATNSDKTLTARNKYTPY